MFIKERADSRGSSAAFEGSTGKILYDIQLEGAETETTAYDYLVANAPTTFTTITGTVYQYQSVSITPQDIGNGILLGEVMYAQPKPLQFTFQTGGGSEKIEYARGDGGVAGSIHTYNLAGDGSTEKDSGNAPDYEGGINVTKTSVEGATIRTANFQFKLTKSWAKPLPINAYGTFAERAAHDGEAVGYRYLSTDGDGVALPFGEADPIEYVKGSGAGVWAAAVHVSGQIDGAYLRDVERMTSMWNLYPVTLIVDGLWMHFLPGELLFEGTDGGKTNDNRYELTCSFSVSRNIDADPGNPADPRGRMLGPLYISEKRGWDLIWAVSEESTDTGQLVRTPKFAYVERVYDFDDFAKLRLEE